ncbi:unnamed protein product [Danaus chrysippus]|uniref:Delta-like protein n=1 Tax=Danaus chrysippus TaxID=151541 RepID=A0A8J2W363_9NEOP|nr:unnamed protein product [Danaus chrysippus]
MRARLPRPTPLLLALALAAALQLAAGAGVFELQILEFSNYRLQLSSGACCGGGAAPPAPAPGAPGAGGACGQPCRTRFALCLKEYQSAAAPGACSFGRASSPVLGTDSFTLSDPLHTLSLPFSFRWTRSFTLILQAYDDYNYTDPEESGLIEEAWWSGIVEPGSEWHALRHAGAAAAVAYRVRVLCQPNYYNTTCTTFCRPRDDKFGHYACSPAGDKRCLPGWQGDNCEKPVCKEGCHPTHGRCDKPGECSCRPGWRGELCSQCQPYPGCKHGYCNGSSWDCTCDTNWGGILCDQDLNYCGTHEPCQHGGTCENTAPDQYLCTCAEGFSGVDCERVDNPCAPQPCAHGTCSLGPANTSPASHAAPAGFVCSCDRGWTGPRCDADVDDCASGPCHNGGVCRDRLDAFLCECTAGWTGATCTEDIDECAENNGGAEGALGPCVNAAACNNSAGGYSCTCLAGWTGRDCELNVDDCTGQCLNGATCIDLVDDFHCACAAGYAGRTCARDVDDCASRPCRNGGECVDLLDAYRCICPVGFSGTDCEEDRDHCTGSPCANGATCYTAQSDYYCHCSPGWTGKNCTQRAAREQLDECTPNPCSNNGSCLPSPKGFTCICVEGFAGETCAIREETRCELVCVNGGSCVRGPLPAPAGGSLANHHCACPPGWAGALCDLPISPPVAPVASVPMQTAIIPITNAGIPCSCLHGGSCVSVGGAGTWACVCRPGWSGAHCERAADGCSSNPCRNGGRCVGGAGWWTCECTPGWSAPDCSSPSCDPTCPSPAVCTASGAIARCVCPPPPARLARRCLELVAGLGEESGEAADGNESGSESTAEASDTPGACGADNGTWWWGCNACRCVGGAPSCTRLWCGLPDCLAPAALPCRTDEVCVPAAPALCLRPPCSPLGECRRVSGRRVEPPALPAPAACWPGARTSPPPGCARAELRLARERLARGAHVERACAALRRALAAALADRAPPAPPLTLLCDLAPDDDDALDLALWAGEEDDSEGVSALAAAVRVLSELISRRRLAHHALLAAALRLRVEHGTPTLPRAAVAEAAANSSGTGGALLALAAGAPLLLLGAAAGAFLLVRRRRAAAAAAIDERSRCRDEEKSNNLQNEENLRRYANPLREDRVPREVDELPRAHSLYKAQNADVRNNTPPRDKELTKRVLPPPEPPPARHPPPERLTVLV